jgi:hypothetical protein
MKWLSWIVWGFSGTVVLTSIMAGAQWLRFTRMSIPYLLGTLFTPDRDKAQLIGIGVHLVNGWAFSLIYLAAFHALGAASWWFGCLIGLTHAAFVLLVAMPALPGMHPRMASLSRGPSASRLLEPPGFLALHYGVRTPIVIVLAHMAFGTLLGFFYCVSC